MARSVSGPAPAPRGSELCQARGSKQQHLVLKQTTSCNGSCGLHPGALRGLSLASLYQLQPSKKPLLTTAVSDAKVLVGLAA